MSGDVVARADALMGCGLRQSVAAGLHQVEWRFARRDVISVAKREAVARLDAFVGPKC
jgi:hypothetical protein